MTTEQEAAPVRAAIYLRISQDHTGEGLGVGRQLEDCNDLAASLGWPVVEVYQDNDVSAVSAKPRPSYRRLLADIQAGEVTAVIAWHADRLYRRMRDLEELLEIVRAHKTQIATVKAGTIDLTTDSGQMIAEILASVASYEGRAKATRWKRSWQQGREAGTVARTGSRLFGYTREGEVVEEEAEIARRMAADIIKGVPILTVSRWLEAEDILTTRGSVWRPGTLKRYLTNPRLAAYSTLKGEIVADGKWQPILDRDTWETVRALLTARTRAYAPRVSLLNGLLMCGKCGHRMITSAARGQRTYRCPNRPGMPGCGSLSVYAEPVEEVVESYAKAKLADDRVRENLLRLSTTAGPELLGEINALEQRLRELDASLDEPGVPVARINRAIARTEERLAECQKRLTAATPVHMPRVGDEWPQDLERRRRLIDLVVSQVRINPAEARSRTFDPRRVEVDPV